MNYDYKQTNLSKAIFGGLFAGLIACGITELYNIIYRSATNFSLSEIINVTSLIFIPLIVLEIAGIFYFLLSKFVKMGRLIYSVLFAVITFVLVMAEINIQRSSDPVLSSEFKWLFAGVTIILGAVAVFVLPYVTKHDVLNE